MVANLPLQYAAADALYAAGLGFLLAFFYTCVRMLLPNTKLFAFVCDLGVFCLSALLYESIAIARFYSGIARWYTILALIIGYAAWQIAAHSKLVFLARLIKHVLLQPLVLLFKFAIMPIFTAIGKQISLFLGKRRKKRKNKTKQLQTPAQVLYNSK